MSTPRTIAILGACSKNGRTAAQKLSAYNHLLLIDENKDELEQLKSEIQSAHPSFSIETSTCMQDTGWEADAIVLALQTEHDKEIFTLMKPYLTGKTVIIFSCGKADDLESLLPHSRIIRINEADCECIHKMQDILATTL